MLPLYSRASYLFYLILLIQEYKIKEECQQVWNDTSIMTWLLENYDTPVARVVPMWKKAYSFEKYVDGNPILILFTPLNPMHVQIPNYMLVST